LCVSTLKHTAQSWSNSMTPALSWKTLMHHGLASLFVAPKMVVLMRLGMLSTSRPAASVTRTSEPKVLWTQCSLQVWAIISSSRSVGSRPRQR